MKSGARSYTEGMKPVILHSDMNNFYASVEILYNSALRDKPVAVAEDEEARHGIVLAKNDIAKGFDIHRPSAVGGPPDVPRTGLCPGPL